MPGPALTVQVKGDTTGLASELDKSGAAVSTWSGKMATAHPSITKVGAAVKTVVPAVTDMTKAAKDDALAQDALYQAVQNSGSAVGDYQQQLDDAVAAGQKLAFTDDEVRTALKQLVPVTGSVDEAVAQLGTAMDLARSKNTSLAVAVGALAKANEGALGPLERFGVVMDEGATGADAIAAATTLAAGQAEAFAKSSEGMSTVAQTAFGELKETIGSVFLPVLQELGPALMPLLEALAELTTAILPLLVPLVGLLADAMGIVGRIVTDVVVPIIDKLVELAGDLQGKLQELIDKVLTPIQGVLDKVSGAINGMFDAIQKVLGPIQEFIDKVAGAIQAVKDFDVLPDINLPDIGREGGIIGGNAAGTSIVNVTIHSGGDPQAVVRAVRKWAYNNGGAAGFQRALG